MMETKISSLDTTSTYNITTIVPWDRRVIFNVMYLSGSGTYAVLPDKEKVVRELARIEPTLPLELQNRNWISGGAIFYIFHTQDSNGRKVISIPVDLINYTLTKVLQVINQQVVIHVDNIKELNNVYRLLRDHNIRYSTDTDN